MLLPFTSETTYHVEPETDPGQTADQVPPEIVPLTVITEPAGIVASLDAEVVGATRSRTGQRAA